MCEIYNQLINYSKDSFTTHKNINISLHRLKNMEKIDKEIIQEIEIKIETKKTLY